MFTPEDFIESKERGGNADAEDNLSTEERGVSGLGYKTN